MDTRRLALVAGGLLLSLLCTHSLPASADEETVPSFTIKQSPAVLLNPNAGELSDLRHFSKDGVDILYDEICMTTKHTRVVFWQKNKRTLALEYFPSPAVTLPNGQKTEVTCPKISELTSQIEFDSKGQYHFTADGSLITWSSPNLSFVPATEHVPSTLNGRITFSPDGSRKSEEVFNAQHVTIKLAHRLDDGGYEETGYFPDKAIEHHRITNKLGVVTAEEINSAGGLPLSTTYSSKESVLTTKYDPVHHLMSFRDVRVPDGAQSTREVFYPDSDKLRLKATYTGSATKATFYRLDGTIERTENLDAYNVTMRYMDTSGLIPLYEQVWTFKSAKGKATDYVMQSMSELNPKGEELKLFIVSDDHTYIKQVDLRKVTKGDMTYPSVFYKYRADGTLEEEQWITPGSLPNPPPVPHAAAEKIKLVVDSNELKHEPFEDLPVPAQISMYWGGH